MVSNFIRSHRATANSFGRLQNWSRVTYIFHEQPFAQISAFRSEATWHFYVRVDNHVHLLYVRSRLTCFEWILAGNQFVHHKAKTVPINTEPVGIFHNHLRCQILGGADEALSHLTIFFAQALFAQTEIC